MRRTRRLSTCPRGPIHPVGVYFSPATRNYYADEFIRSYRGILILLMQKHLEFQIVTPRTLAEFKGDTLVLPDVRILSDSEKTLATTIRWSRQETYHYRHGRCPTSPGSEPRPNSTLPRKSLRSGVGI